MDQTPKRSSKKPKSTSKGILKYLLMIYKWSLSFFNKAIEKRVEDRKREFFLKYKVEMTEKEIQLVRNKLILSLLFIIAFIVYIIYEVIT